MDVFDLCATISIKLDGYEKGLAQAKTKAESFAKGLSSLSSDISKAYSGLGDLLSPLVDGFQAVESVGKTAATGITTALKGFAAAGTVVGGFMTQSVKTGATFDSAMSQVMATMGASVEDLHDTNSEAYESFQLLRNAAIESGATTAFSATESANALNYMALAGYDVETSIGMLPTVLNLAAAGSIDLASASDMITDAQSALGLSLEDTVGMVDQMAVTASKSNTSVAQLGEAILTVGGTASYMANGTSEINAVLGVLADNGIKGSEAGTHLRNMLLSLSSPTKDANALLNSLGVNVFDTDGKMRSFSEIFPELNASMSELTDQQKLDAFSTLFNSRDIAAATALLGTTTERWEELGDAIMDAEGAAEMMAAVQLDNLQGDVTLLQSAFEGLQIVISDALTPTVREFAQFGAKAMDELRKGFQGDGVNGFMSALTSIVTDGVIMLTEKASEFASVSLQFIGALADGILGARNEIAFAAANIFSVLIDGVGSWLSTNSGELIGAGNQIIAVLFSAFLQAGQLIKDNIGQFIPLIARAFIDYHDALFLVGIDILGAIGQGIIDNQEGIQNMASTAIMEMVTALRDNAPAIIEGGIALLEALVGAIEENLPLIIETGAEIIGQLVAGIATASPAVQAIIGAAVLPHILKIGETAADIGVAFLDVAGVATKALSGINDAISSVVKFAQGGITTILSVGKTLMSGIQALFGLIMAHPVVAVVTAVITAVVLLWTKCEWFRDGVKAVLEAIGGSFVTAYEVITGAFAGAVEFFSGIVSGIKGAFDGIGEFLGGLFAAAWGAVQGAWNVAVEFFAGIGDGINAVFEAVTGFLGDAFSAAWSAITAVWDAAVGFFGGIWDSIKSAAGTAAENVGSAFKSAWDAIISVWDGAVSFFAGIVESIIGVFADIGSSFLSIGGNIVNGLMNGISNAWSSFIGWLGSKINGIVDAVKGMLGIHSPSTVFAGIGENMALGLGKGWADEYSDIKRKITNGLSFDAGTVGITANGSYSLSGAAQNGAQAGFGGAGNTYVTINSPVAVDAVTAAREWKKTTQRMAMAYV